MMIVISSQLQLFNCLPSLLQSLRCGSTDWSIPIDLFDALVSQLGAPIGVFCSLLISHQFMTSVDVERDWRLLIDLISRIGMYGIMVCTEYGLMYSSYYLHVWILLAFHGNSFSSTVDCLIIRIYTWYKTTGALSVPMLITSSSLACSTSTSPNIFHEIHQIPTLVIRIQ